MGDGGHQAIMVFRFHWIHLKSNSFAEMTTIFSMTIKSFEIKSYCNEKFLVVTYKIVQRSTYINPQHPQTHILVS